MVRPRKDVYKRQKLNYDHPDSFDTELLVQHLQALRRGESVKAVSSTHLAHGTHTANGGTGNPTVALVQGAVLNQQGSKGALALIQAVSYTHLDVYKRQLLPSACSQQSNGNSAVLRALRPP